MGNTYARDSAIPGRTRKYREAKGVCGFGGGGSSWPIQAIVSRGYPDSSSQRVGSALRRAWYPMGQIGWAGLSTASSPWLPRLQFYVGVPATLLASRRRKGTPPKRSNPDEGKKGSSCLVCAR